MSSSGTMPNTTSTPTISRGAGRSRTPLIAGIAAVVVVVIIIVVAGWSAGWFNSKSSGGGGGATTACTADLTGAGSTLVQPLVTDWSTAYNSYNSSWPTPDYGGGGSSAGITDISQKTIDFGASDAPLNPAQRAAAPGLITIPESAGAVAVIYNVPGITASLNFNGTVIAQIELGQITNWNDTPLQTLNKGVSLPNHAITTVHRSDGSGTTFIFTSYLSLESSTWATQVGKGTAVNWPVGIGSKGNGGVATTVSTQQYTVGYVDLNYALNTGGVTAGKVLNPSGNFIYPTVADSQSALTDLHPVLPAAAGDWYNVSLLNAPGSVTTRSRRSPTSLSTEP